MENKNLPATAHQIVAALTANGMSEATIRDELNLSAREWNQAMKEKDSPLAQAVADGRARLVESAMAVIIESIRAGDVATAKWLFEKYATDKKKDPTDSINLTLTLPLAMSDYLRIVDAETEPCDGD